MGQRRSFACSLSWSIGSRALAGTDHILTVGTSSDKFKKSGGLPGVIPDCIVMNVETGERGTVAATNNTRMKQYTPNQEMPELQRLENTLR